MTKLKLTPHLGLPAKLFVELISGNSLDRLPLPMYMSLVISNPMEYVVSKCPPELKYLNSRNDYHHCRSRKLSGRTDTNKRRRF